MVDAERRLLSGSGYEVATLDFQNPTSRSSSFSALVQGPWNFGAARRAVGEAERHEADVVHIHNTWFALSPAVVPALRRAGFPVVMTFHNYRLVCLNAMLYRNGQPCELCVGGSTLPGIRYRCYRDSLGASTMASATIQFHRRRETWADGLSVAVVLTEFAKKRLLMGGLPDVRTVVKPNFVGDPGQRLEPPSKSTEVLFVGRLAPEKGIGRLVDVWQHADLGGLKLEVIGSGPLAKALEGRVQTKVRLVGPLPSDQVRAKMLGARALVVPSLWYEVQPMVVLEGLAAGLPVFHTDLGALGETSGAGGISLGSGDAAEMAVNLRKLKDDQLVDGTGGAGRFEFESRFSEQASLEEFDRIYRRALA